MFKKKKIKLLERGSVIEKINVVSILLLLSVFLFIEDAKAATSDLVYDYSDIGFSSACSYYTLTYSGDSFDWLSDISTLAISKVNTIGQFDSKVSSSNWEWYANVSYIHTEPNCVRTGFPPNIVETCKPKNVTKYRMAWVKNLPENIELYKNQLYSKVSKGSIPVRFCADFQREWTKNGFEIAIDHIPSFAGKSYLDYTWWNTSWLKKKPINVSTATALTEYQIELYVTYDSDMASDFSDIRFTNASENDQLEYWIESKSDSSWAYVWVKGNFSTANGTQIYMYYDNTSEVLSEENCSATMIMCSLFNEELWEYPTGWTVSTGGGGNFTINSSESVEGNSLRVNGSSPPNSSNYMLWTQTLPMVFILEFSVKGEINTDNGPLVLYIDNSTGNQGLYPYLYRKDAIQYYHSDHLIYNYTDYDLTGMWAELRINIDTNRGMFNTTINDTTFTEKGFYDTPYNNLTRIYWQGFYNGSGFIDNFRIRANTTIEPTYSIGSEESLTSGTNTIVLNTPIDKQTGISTTVNFTYTPTFTLGSILNCSLWTNESGSWSLETSRASGIVNDSVNGLLGSFTDEGVYAWNVRCANSTAFTWAVSNYTYHLDTATPPIITLNKSITVGFITYRTGNVTVNVSDTVSPYQYCNISVKGTNYTNVTFANNYSTFDINFTDGSNPVYATCWDMTNNTGFASDLLTIYIKNITLINEQNGSIFSNFSAMSMLRVISESTGIIFDFMDSNDTSVNFITDNSSEILRLEKKYVGSSDILFIDLRTDVLEGNDTRVCVADPQTFYEVIAYSSQGIPMAMVNNLANCYVVSDYTKYAYSNAFSQRAFTIPALYYLYIYDDGQKILLSSVDGSYASAINLDALQFTAESSSINFTLSSKHIVITRESNTSLLMYYNNQENDNSYIDIDVYDNITLLFSYTEYYNPNNFTMLFDYSSLTITGDVIRFVITEYKIDGTTDIETEIFILSLAKKGVIPASLAIIISGCLLFFGLTMVAARDTFSYFGLFVILIALGVTALAEASAALRFFQGIIVVVLIFSFIAFKEEFSKIT